MPSEEDSETYIELSLKENCHVKPPNAEYLLLRNNEKKYFDEIKAKNKYRITKDWDLEAYVKGFKAAKKDICKLWKVWMLKA